MTRGERMAAAVGVSEGQLYTVVIGAALAVVLLVSGIPPTRRANVVQPASRVAAPVLDQGDSEFAPDEPPAPATPPPEMFTPPAALAFDPAAPPPPSATTTTTSTPQPRSPTAEAGPLRVVYGRWSTGASGTVAGHPDVPPDGLPVGAQFGEDDTRSYVRLTGTESMLRLAESDAAGANRGATPQVRACRVTEAGWAMDNGVAHADAPPYDTAKCVAGERVETGVWSFDLRGFTAAERSDGRGFALVPLSAEAPFQVVFSRTPPS